MAERSSDSGQLVTDILFSEKIGNMYKYAGISSSSTNTSPSVV